MIYSDAAYKANNKMTSFGFVMTLNGIIMDAGAIQGLKVASSKETEAMAVLIALEKVRGTDFDRVHVLVDAKKVMQALKRDQDRSINPIISDIKPLATLFRHIEFN